MKRSSLTQTMPPLTRWPHVAISFSRYPSGARRMIRNFRKGVRLAHRAVDIGKNDSEALWMAGLALVQLGGEIDHGMAKIERPLQSIPIRQTPGRQVALRAATSAIRRRQTIISRRPSASTRWTFRTTCIGTPLPGIPWGRTDRGRAQRGADTQPAPGLSARSENEDEHMRLAGPHGRSARMRRPAARSTAILHRGLDEQSPESRAAA